MKKKLLRLIKLIAMSPLSMMGVFNTTTPDQAIYFDSGVSVFQIKDAGGTLRNLSAYIKELKGLPGQFTTNDVGGWSSVGERPGAGPFVVHFTMELEFNMVTDVGVDTVLGPMHATKALRDFEYYPAGTTTGNLKLSGQALLPVYELTSRYKAEVTAHCEFHVDNGITRG